MVPVRIVALLRERVFALTAQDLELDDVTRSDVWGVTMELGLAEEMLTLVALADGSVSIYLRSGKGRIGCGLHPEVRAAAGQLLRWAKAVSAVETPHLPYPTPADGEVQFYFHTPVGLRTRAAARHQLDEGEIELAELYYAAHAVIGMVELTGAGEPIGDAIESATASVKSQASITSALSTKGKPCRILPSVGNVGRRSRR